MLSRLKAFGQRRMVRAVAVVVGGTAGAQLITVLASPVLSRLFTPAEFGGFAAFSAVAAILAGMGAMRLENAVPLAAHEDRAMAVARLGLIGSAGIAMVTLAVCLVMPAAVEQVTAVPHHLQLLLPVYVLGFGGAAVLGQVAIRRRQYGLFARRKIVQTGSTVVVQTAAGVARFGAAGLAFGYAAGQIIAFLSLVRVSGIFRGRTSMKELRAAARDYRRFPLVLMPSGLLNSMGTHAPTLLIVGLFGVTVGGLYGMTQRVLAAPVGLLGTSLSQVYIGELANLKRKRVPTAADLFRRTSRALWGASLALAVAVAVLAAPLFPVIFGEQWRSSGQFAQALSIGIAGQLAAAPLAQTLVVTERLGRKFLWDAGRLVSMSAAVIVPAALDSSALSMMWCLGAVQAGVYVVLWLLCRAAAADLVGTTAHGVSGLGHDTAGASTAPDDEGSTKS